MKWSAVFISAAISATLQTAYGLVVTIVGLLTILLSQNPGVSPMPLLGLSSLLGCLGTILSLFVHLGTGLLFAFLNSRDDKLSVEDGLLGGASSAALARLAFGFLNAIFSIISSQFILGRVLGAVGQPAPNGFGLIFGLNMASGMVGAIVGICTGVFAAAVLGAIGGAIGAALFGE